MRIVVTALAVGIFLPVALAVCSCGDTTVEIPLAIIPKQLNNPKDNVTNTDCAMNCTYTFTFTGTGAKSISAHYIFFVPSTNNEECLTFYDGVGTNGTIISPTNCVSAPSVPTSSYSPSMTIDLTTTTLTPSTAASFRVAITVIDPVTPGPTTTPTTPTTPTTTMPTTTTSPYNGSFSCDPASVQMDLVILIDCSALVDADTFAQIKSFMQTNLLSLLSIQPNNSVRTQVTASFTSPNLAFWGLTIPWKKTGSEISAFIRDNVDRYAQEPSYYTTIKDTEVATANAAATDMKNAGVRIMTVQIGSLSNNSIGMLASPGLNLSFADGQSLVDNGMNQFINDAACNGYNLCGGCGVRPTAISNSVRTNFSLPTNYPKYCNLMTCLWTFNTTADYNASVTFDWFDVEFALGTDYIEVFDGNMKGLARFSGYNIKGAQVTAGTPAIVVKFTSNVNNVYTGFQAGAIAVQSSSSVEVFGESLPNPDHLML